MALMALKERLVATEITDNKDHFVRNHGGIPEIDPQEYTLDISGLVKNPKRLTLADLQNEELFPRQSNVVTLQCSGTRRLEQINVYPGDGDELINAPWGEGAIGTARWTGVSLKKVIKYCGGLKDGADNLEFYGADTYFKKGQVYNYAVSVPWRKVRANEVLLAWEMNGEPIPKIHGYPLRTVVFGYIGARSCKWLYEIKAIAGPSEAPVQKKEYLYYTPQVGKQNALYSNGFSIQDMPVSSAIMTPEDKNQIIHDGKIKLRGWAYSGGGHWPIRVEVSGDGGSVWYEVPPENMTTKYFHSWRLWEIDLPVDAEGWLEFCVRCWDNALNTQPTFVRSAWYVLYRRSGRGMGSHGKRNGNANQSCLRVQELGLARNVQLPSHQHLQHQPLKTVDGAETQGDEGEGNVHAPHHSPAGDGPRIG